MLAAGFLLAGCYEAFPPSGVPCKSDVEDSCPSGQSCIRGTCRSLTGGVDASTIPEVDASTVDGPPSDLDGDMIPNANDNCPNTSNSDQHDEDADTVGDVCDNCPHVANTNQAKTGEPTTVNGAGDACDPRPGIPGDTIQKFYSFHVPPAGTSTTGDGAWGITADTYQHTGGGFTSLIVAGARDKVTVEVAGTLESTTSFMALTVSVGGANGNYHECGYYECNNCGPTEYLNAFIDYWDNQANNYFKLMSNNVSQRLTGAFTIRVSSDSTLKRIVCTTTDMRASTTKQFNQADVLVPGTVGVYSDTPSYRLRYLVIFGQP
jgi:hypothetical protein